MSVQQPLSSTDFDVGWPFVVTPAKKWKLNTTSDAVAKKSDSFRSPIKLKLIPYNTAIAAIVNTNNDYESCNNHTATTATVATSVLSSDNGVRGRPPLPSRKNSNKVDQGWWTTTVDTESGGTDSIYINSNGYYNSLQEQPEKTNGFYSNNTINRHQRNRLDESVVEQQQQRQEPLYRYSNTNNQPIAASLSNININNNCQGFSSGGSATLKNAASFGSRQNFGDNITVVGLLTARKSCLTTTRSSSKCNNNNNNDAASTSTLLLAKECTSTPTSAFIAAASCSSSSSSSHVAPTSLSNSNDNSNIGYCVTTNGNNAGSAIIPSKLRAAKSESCLKSSSTNGGDMSSSTTHNGSQASILLSDRDLDQVEMMYSSQGTKVFVCNCLANLYFNQINNNNNNKTAGGYQTQWELIVTGIPVVVMNCGESRCRTTRQLSIVLAERGTGFTLWKEAITNYTNYEEIERTFHTLNSSTEAGRLAGLSFDNASSASKFHQHVKALFKETSSLNNNNSNNQRNSTTNSSYSKQKSSSTATVSNEYLYAAKKQRRHSFVGGSKKVILRKAEISTPVCFKHITSVKPADLNPVILTGAGDSAVPKRAQSCVQILTIGDGSFKSIQ